MKYIIYGIIYLLAITNLILESDMDTMIISINLVMVIFIILKERFFDNLVFSILIYIMVFVVVTIYPQMYLLLALVIFDLWFKKTIYTLSLVVVFSFIVIYFFDLMFIIICVLSSVIGYLLKQKSQQQEHYLLTLDEERRLRYELESVKHQLIQNNLDIERLTEIKERNRIAREIHDNIGHDITGVLIQLQAANRIYKIDQDKANKIVEVCVDKLNNSLELIRDTVHNIKPSVEISEDVFNEVVRNYIYCPVEFKFCGDIKSLSPLILDVLLLNLKESLTNAAKYSGATKIDINIFIHDNYVRYCYQDNGQGCANISEGLGISGMKERIKSLNGSIDFSSEKGFSIISVIPLKTTNIFME